MAETREEEAGWENSLKEAATAGASSASPATTSNVSTGARKPAVSAQSVSFQALQPASQAHDSVDFNFLLDIPLEVKVEIGRTKMLINDLLQLGQGSVIELSKPNTETSFDVLVNDKIVARGEIVVINDRFGVRLTDIISPLERVQQIA
ncbi:MAG: flagellar motor switch protein FliN [Candidatus Sumerlaeota bacterium]|nr:flagellar motor switch protein FliN [Candidatus Sumerlaeota bacterium]